MYDREKPVWICSYRGASDHSFKGNKYECRSFACPGDGATATSADGHYNGYYYFVGILPCVGTIRNASGNYHSFPPDEVCAFFPDYIPARWNEDFTQLIYKGAKPETVLDVCGHVVAKALAEKHSVKSA